MIDSDLTRQPTSGSDVQRLMARIHVACVARYKLVDVQGRPEELELPGSDQLRCSLGYGSKTVRVRKQVERTWLDHIDLQIEEASLAKALAYLDPHFGYAPPTPASMRPRPIRDNPQA